MGNCWLTALTIGNGIVRELYRIAARALARSLESE